MRSASRFLAEVAHSTGSQPARDSVQAQGFSVAEDGETLIAASAAIRR